MIRRGEGDKRHITTPGIRLVPICPQPGKRSALVGARKKRTSGIAEMTASGPFCKQKTEKEERNRKLSLAHECPKGGRAGGSFGGTA